MKIDLHGDSKSRQIFSDTVENPDSSSSIDNHKSLKTRMVIGYKQLDNYKPFTRQDDIKWILRNISHCLRDIDVCLSRVESNVVLDLASGHLSSPLRGTTNTPVDNPINL